MRRPFGHLLGEPGSRRHAWWDLVVSAAIVVVFTSLAVPDAVGDGVAWPLLPLFAWAVVANAIHARRALRRLREPEP